MTVMSIPLRTPVAVALIAGGILIGACTQDTPRILAVPTELDMGDLISVQIQGLPRGEQVDLVCELEEGGQRWRSQATFAVSADGTVDPSRQAPLAGDWEGVDPLGAFWSMASTGEVEDQDPPSVDLVLRAVRGKDVLARTKVKIWRRRPGVTEESVTASGMVASFFTPATNGRSPAVILVGGSGGGIGWQRGMARSLANHGYAALALAYFDAGDLPESLDEIPLEYFGRAIEWLRGRPEVDPGRVAVAGISKGGELALLLGATFDELRAVVAFVPSSVVWQGIAPGWPLRSSWTFGGEGLPFVPYDMNLSGSDLLDLYRGSLQDQDAVRAAVLRVERTVGAVLLFSGGEDSIWPSTLMCEQVVGRLKEHGFEHPFEHIAYSQAGHTIASSSFFATSRTIRNGGSAQSNAYAIHDAWSRTLAFLVEHLRP